MPAGEPSASPTTQTHMPATVTPAGQKCWSGKGLRDWCVVSAIPIRQTTIPTSGVMMAAIAGLRSVA